MKKLIHGLGLMLASAASHAAAAQASFSTDDYGHLSLKSDFVSRRRLLECERVSLDHQETNMMNKRAWGVRGIR